MINFSQSPKPGLPSSRVLFLLSFLLFVSTASLSQTKPAAPKSSAAKPAAARSVAAKPAGAKPAATKSVTVQKSTATSASPKKTVTKTPAARTSGQAVTTRPVPVKSEGSSAQKITSNSAGSPTKTADTPVNDYKAKQHTASAPQSSGKQAKSYGLAFNQNDKLLNVGVGLSSYYYGTPIGVSFEAGVHRDISVGVQLDYNSGRYDDYYYSSYNWGYKAYYLGVRGSYHFNRLLKIRSNKFDLYAGVGLGYQSFKWDDRSYGYGYDYSSGLFFNYFAGAKFYFTPKVAAFAELGYTGLSSSRIGIAFKF